MPADWQAILDQQPESVRFAFIPYQESAALSSEFIFLSLQKNPQLLPELLHLTSQSKAGLAASVAEQLQDVTDEASLMRVSRQFRMQHMLRIAWGDLTGQFDLLVVMQELSQLADVLLAHILKKLMEWAVIEMGQPQDASKNQELIIIALGKLGGKELNFSSDVDLMFAYPSAGMTTAGMSNETFFTKLAQRFIYVLQTPTEDGFVFRVDMRLRPYGDAGPLVMSFAQLAVYYQEQGRQWERYALVKARCVQAEKHWVSAWTALIKPFVYRRYLDYGSIESLRDMKRLIEREVAVKNLQNDVKRGPGGIRQIEFIGQVFQLIRGGSERRLQQRKLLPVLRYLKRMHILPSQTIDELTTAYRFLRMVEHRLQMVRDQQTHTLPTDPSEQTNLALAMGYDNWSEFLAVLNAHQTRVVQYFENMLQPAQPIVANSDFQPKFVAFWAGALNEADAWQLLKNMGIAHPQDVLPVLIAFRDSYRCRQLQADARTRLITVMPLFLLQIALQENPASAFLRVIHLLEAIVRRSAYLVLLIENPQALTRVVQVIAKSPWIAEKVTSSPFLLDEFIREEKLMKPLREEKLADQLRQVLLGIPEQEFEEQRESVRAFKLQIELRTAIAEIEGTLPLMKISDQLSFIAGVVLARAREITAKELSEQYGDLDAFAIIAYGKLGGLEMSYLSDLDLVFLHDMPTNDAPIRMAQRIIHMQNTRTTHGVLYQVDTRLRPSGTAGLLVSRIDAFVQYQMSEAWLWEHQALIRARFICGSQILEAQFNQARMMILTQKRDPVWVRSEVSTMREKMRAQPSPHADQFDIKNVEGGITDIEFIAHYGALVHAHQYPSVVKWTDTIRILEALGDEDCFPIATTTKLIQIYQAYRAYLHQCILTGTPSLDSPIFVQERAFVTECWQVLLGVHLAGL